MAQRTPQKPEPWNDRLDKLNLPVILDIPPKLYPIITQFNQFRYFLIEGGRGSAKSQTVGRFLLYLGEQRRIRVVCGREIQANIEESVYTLLKDLIAQYNLAYDVFAHKIVHKFTGTEFRFKGFREQGSVSIKGLEGCDILWIDEAQSITKPTLDIIMPTIRKEKSRIFFTMNRFMRDDAVPELLVGDPQCLHIQINYFENPFCPLNLKIQAENMLRKSERDYNHIWLGMPLSTADDYLFNYEKLFNSLKIQPFGDIFGRQRVMGIDFAAQGNDMCVATLLERVSNQHWKLAERTPWSEPDTTVSIGKIVHLIGIHKPDAVMIDIGGMGKVVYDRLIEIGIKNLFPFDGGSTAGVDTEHYGNIRSAAYHLTRDWFGDNFLCLDEKDREVLKELEKIKFKYRSNGVRFIQAKPDMKKDIGYSPDNADSLVIAIWCAHTCLGKSTNSIEASAGKVVRKSQSQRHRR